MTLQLDTRSVRVVSSSLVPLAGEVDAIVSSDDGFLSHGGGVSAAIWDAAGNLGDHGPALRLPVGTVFVSGAGRLPCKHVLHVITKDFVLSENLDAAQLRPTLLHMLRTAEDLGCQSLALPLVGTGAAHLNPRDFAAGLASALAQWWEGPSNLHTIIVSAHVVDPSLVTGPAAVAITPDTGFDGLLLAAIGSAPAIDTGAAGLAMAAQDVLAEPWSRRGAALVGLYEAALLLLAPRAAAAATPGLPELVSIVAQAHTGDSAERHERNALQRAAAAAPWAMRDEAAGETTLTVLAGLRAALTMLGRLPTLRKPVITQGPLHVRLDEITVSSRMALPSMIAGITTGAVVVANPSSPLGWKSRVSLSFDATGPYDGRAATQGEPQTADRPTSRVHSGTQPVRRLHAFLLDMLDTTHLADLSQRLDDERGYQGDPALRLLEYCVREERLQDFLASEFRRSELAAALKKMGLSPDAADAAGLAEQLLCAFGFPPATDPQGLAQLMAKAGQARHAVGTCDQEDILANVLGVSTGVEWACRTLLQFVCLTAYGMPAEQWAAGHQAKLLNKGSDLARASLGTLLGCLDRLADDLSESPSRARHIFGVDLAARRLVPTGLRDGLARLRNTFAHGIAGDPEARRRDARDFLNQAVEFLSYLQSPRIFPRFIALTSIEYDRRGRRVVKAIDDNNNVEVLFTDEPLEAGKVYMMHPLSNPLRVDPVLHAAGDLSVKIL